MSNYYFHTVQSKIINATQLPVYEVRNILFSQRYFLQARSLHISRNG